MKQRRGPAYTDKRYSTGQAARILAVHPNTIRWYEKTGVISPAERLPNGYRQFNERHMTQLRICRLIFGSPYTNKTIRDAAFAVMEPLRDWDMDAALARAKTYRSLLKKEHASALETTEMLRTWTEQQPKPSGGASFTRKEAALLLGVSTEVMRNWERNGLLCVERKGGKNERVYGTHEINRLRVVYMLRQNNFSIAAIHNSLTQYDSGNVAGAALALNQPALEPDGLYTAAGDHWLEVLEELLRDAKKIIRILREQ